LTFQTDNHGAGDADVTRFKSTTLPTGDVYDTGHPAILQRRFGEF
jgi:hypothetical protein